MVDSYWTILQVRTGWESGLKRSLDREGLGHFHPFIQHMVVRYGKRRIRFESMFPGYLFLKMKSDLSCWAIERLPGAIRILKQSGTPVQVAEDFISKLDESLVTMKRGPFSVRVLPRTRKWRFLPRQVLRFVKGPYEGIGAQFLTMRGEERCRVLLSMFGRPTEVDCSLDQLQAAAA